MAARPFNPRPRLASLPFRGLDTGPLVSAAGHLIEPTVHAVDRCQADLEPALGVPCVKHDWLTPCTADMDGIERIRVPTPFGVGQVNCFIHTAGDVTLIDPGPTD